MKSMLIPFAAALLLSAGGALAQSEPAQPTHRHGMMMHKHDMPMHSGGMQKVGMQPGSPGHEGHQGHEGQDAMTCPMMKQMSMMQERIERLERGQGMPVPTR